MRKLLKKLLALSLSTILLNTMLPVRADDDLPIVWDTKYITLNANGGKFSNDSTEFSVQLNDEYHINNIKDIQKPVSEDDTKEFSGWTRSDGSAIADMAKATFVENEVVYATYKTKIIAVKSLSYDQTSVTLTVGESAKPNVTITPANATDQSISYTSSASDVAMVDVNGMIRAISPGTATVTATSSNDQKATCKVTVKGIEASDITLSISSLALKIGDSASLNATISPSDTTDKTVTFVSSAPKIASVDENGTVTALKEGTTTITASTSNGISATCTVNVYSEINEVTSVSLNRINVTVDEGDEFSLAVVVLPTNATDKTITWQSQNPEVASVDQNGKVSAHLAGTTTITATSTNGMTASCEVKVNQIILEVTSITITKNELTLREGESAELQVNINPSSATNQSVLWTSHDPKVATVDKSGKVTAMQLGSVTIAATTGNGKSATCGVSVIANDPAACRVFGFCHHEDNDYWFEGGLRQAVPGDKKNLWDEIYHEERGREVYDPETKAWYWLDTIYDGAKATSKEVWIPYIFQDEAPGSTEGKWVRYNKVGKMIKGWYRVNNALDKSLYPDQVGNVYYYDLETGAMYKGWHTINGKLYHFDEQTGALV